MPVPAAKNTVNFPIKSLLQFISGAILLRLLSVACGVFFPGDGLIPRVARVFVLLLSVAGLVLLNRVFLNRSGCSPDAPGIRANPSRLGWFAVGAVTITLIVGAIVGALWLVVPFHYQRGLMSASQFSWKSAEYFAGNWGEELIFRSYLLLVVARRFGLRSALMSTSILFGLFHLPGLSGLAAFKMVCTTSLAGCLYAYGYLLTGTLWTAAGLHVVGNIVLHNVLGDSNQNSLFMPVFDDRWPTSYDPAFLVWLVVFLPIIALAAQLEHRQWANGGIQPWQRGRSD